MTDRELIISGVLLIAVLFLIIAYSALAVAASARDDNISYGDKDGKDIQGRGQG